MAVCVEPFLLRSTLHAALAEDERFVPSLCPIEADPALWGPASGASIILASEPLQRPELCVVVLSPPNETVSVTYSGACLELTYVDIPSLCNQLIEHGTAFERRGAAS